jgi:hypothetical protein
VTVNLCAIAKGEKITLSQSSLSYCQKSRAGVVAQVVRVPAYELKPQCHQRKKDCRKSMPKQLIRRNSTREMCKPCTGTKAGREWEHQ